MRLADSLPEERGSQYRNAPPSSIKSDLETTLHHTRFLATANNSTHSPSWLSWTSTRDSGLRKAHQKPPEGIRKYAIWAQTERAVAEHQCLTISETCSQRSLYGQRAISLRRQHTPSKPLTAPTEVRISKVRGPIAEMAPVGRKKILVLVLRSRCRLTGASNWGVSGGVSGGIECGEIQPKLRLMQVKLRSRSGTPLASLSSFYGAQTG